MATAFDADQKTLVANQYQVTIDLHQPGYIRATVGGAKAMTKVERAHDSAWRFMPTVEHDELGYQLHPIDLAINKVLALAGRDEPRDFIDVIYTHETILPLGALCWAAAGKDPGFTPLSLLELSKRRGKYQPEDFARLMLTRPVDQKQLKGQWLEMLAESERFIKGRPPSEVGCLYYSPTQKKFVAPPAQDREPSKKPT